jgi:hypothetical protein
MISRKGVWRDRYLMASFALYVGARAQHAQIGVFIALMSLG